MVKGISSFSLMAVPFFITMGVLMGSGGISEKLIALADACVGWMRGGMAMVNIVASYFFGGISGSASAAASRSTSAIRLDKRLSGRNLSIDISAVPTT
jgi:TRAP-type C4-dicarboxylate transport system permease large subunit